MLHLAIVSFTCLSPFLSAGSDSTSQIIEGAIIFLIELFRDCKYIGPKQTSELRRMFGIIPQKVISEAFEIVKKFVAKLNEDIQDNFIRNGFPKVDEGLLVEEFGSKIKVVAQTPLDDSFYLIPIKEDNDAEDAFEKLSFKFKEEPKENLNDPVMLQQTLPQIRKFNKDWLENALRDSQGSSANISPVELCMTVCQLLKTSKSNEEIQSEVSMC